MFLVGAEGQVEEHLRRRRNFAPGFVAAAAALRGHEDFPEFGLVHAELAAQLADFFASIGLEFHVGAPVH